MTRTLSVVGCSVVLAGRAGAQAPAAVSANAAAQLCDHAMNGERHPEAKARAQAMGAGGNTAAAAFARGCLSMGEERFDKAGDEFERAVNADPTNAVYHLELGQAYGMRAMRANPIKQALLARKIKAEFERAVALDPDLLDAHAGLATFYLYAPGIVGGSVERARQQAEEIRRRNAYRGGFAAVQIAYRQKDFAGAARDLEALTRQYPDSAVPYTSLATLYEQQKRWPEAWGVIDRMLAAMPNIPVAQYALGRLAQESGQQLDRGAAAFVRYLQTTPGPGDPPLANAHWRLGLTYEQQAKKDAARAEFEAALKLDPKLAGAREGLERTR